MRFCRSKAGLTGRNEIATFVGPGQHQDVGPRIPRHRLPHSRIRSESTVALTSRLFVADSLVAQLTQSNFDRCMKNIAFIDLRVPVPVEYAWDVRAQR